MAKMNMAAVASKVGGMAVGVAAGGILSNYFQKNNFNTLYSSLGMVAAGIFLPPLIGKGSAMIGHAGDALIAKGVNQFMVGRIPGIAGSDDEVSGVYDDSVNGYPDSDQVIVSGPYDPADSVSGHIH